MNERFTGIGRAICFQQLSGKAAGAIWARTIDLCGGEISPQALLAAGPDRLRSCGLSWAKVNSLLDLSLHVEREDLKLSNLGRVKQDKAIAELTQVKGIGLWTAQMFLMFQIGRLDIWPTGDLGVRKGYALIKKYQEVPDAEELQPEGNRFSPYRSVAAWYCWRATDDPEDTSGW